MLNRDKQWLAEDIDIFLPSRALKSWLWKTLMTLSRDCWSWWSSSPGPSLVRFWSCCLCPSLTRYCCSSSSARWASKHNRNTSSIKTHEQKKERQRAPGKQINEFRTCTCFKCVTLGIINLWDPPGPWTPPVCDRMWTQVSEVCCWAVPLLIVIPECVSFSRSVYRVLHKCWTANVTSLKT